MYEYILCVDGFLLKHDGGKKLSKTEIKSLQELLEKEKEKCQKKH